MTHQPWIQTHTGRPFPLMTPAAEDVDFRVMAVALGRLCRFGGHCTAFYSVAQHSVLAVQVMEEAVRTSRGRALLMSAVPTDQQHDVHKLFRRVELDDEALRKLQLATLLHDGHEAYIGDIATPVAQAIARCAGDGYNPVAFLKTGVDIAVACAAGLTYPMPMSWHAAIKAADLVMLATEKRDLMVDGPEWAQRLPAPASFAIKPQPEHLAADTFLQRLNGLLPRASFNLKGVIEAVDRVAKQYPTGVV